MSKVILITKKGDIDPGHDRMYFPVLKLGQSIR